ncbi:tetratricopeptide repeat protein [Reinekea thalattae]|uniref:Tetratricopeptide repeat protein n=1 Tax=Reinekea thalattae TaxID=2593301 RepID=A0A5C8ZAM5_9GAMM|nr:tetratricopeptide repeat protein [Reinekea thalattae]TXR54203.1 tetratricopeptide repeat protein [Reinekea thalattae]
MTLNQRNISSYIEKELAKGAELQQAGKFDLAETVYKELLIKHPEVAEGWFHLGMIAYHFKRPDIAIRFISKAAHFDKKMRNTIARFLKSLVS